MNEKMLYNLKWHDYRPYMPDTATMIFIGEWVAAYDALLTKMGFDHYEDDRGKVVKKDFPYAHGNIVYLKAVNRGGDWKRFEKLRQAADSRMIPYWLFWEVGLKTMIDYDGFEFGLQAFENSMLVGSTFDHLRTRINEGPLVFARMPFLQPDEYRGTQIQKDYCGHIVHRIESRYGDRAKEKLAQMSGVKLPEAYLRENLLTVDK